VNTTAASAGLVTGVASLLLDYDANLTPDDIREVLRRTADDVGDPGFDTKTGYGILDAQAAFDYVQERDFVRGVATNGTSQKVRDNEPVTLFKSPWGVLSSGQYSADVYKVTFTVSLPSGASHDVWYRSADTEGWGFANPCFKIRGRTSM